MNRSIAMALRNLRTEIEYLEKGQERLQELEKENARLKVQLKQQEQIDSLTELGPIFNCDCGWKPLPGAIVDHNPESQMWLCPNCKIWHSYAKGPKKGGLIDK
jgi:hypothetical protein